MEDQNLYLEYLENHPKLVDKAYWPDRQYDSNQNITEYIAYFYLLKYENTYIGILESTRPNTATYLYAYPDEYIRFRTFIYRTHIAEPAIKRKFTEEEKEEIKKIVAELEELDDDITDLEKEEELDNKLTFFLSNKPIKYRRYFIDRIMHNDIKTWKIQLEYILDKYLRDGKQNIRHMINDLHIKSMKTKLSIFMQTIMYDEIDILTSEIISVYNKKKTNNTTKKNIKK